LTEDLARLADFANRLRRFLWTTSQANSFFAFGMVLTAYWLIGISLGLEDVQFLYWALGMIPAIALCVASIYAAMPKRAAAKPLSMEGARWIASFALPFASLYMAYVLLIERVSPAMLSILWYPALGIALLLAHFLLERPWMARGLMVAKPFLVSSLLALAGCPVVVYAALTRGALAASLLSLGLMLLSYYVAGIYALIKASRLFS